MDLSGYVGTLNLLGDENRIRMCALLRERELSVTDLVRVTGISQSRVSTHLARLREAIGKISGVEQVELNGRPGRATLRIRGKADAATLIVAAKSAGFDLQPPPLRSFIATGSSRDEDIGRLREALRKLDGMEQFEVRGQNGGATVHVQGDMKGSDLVSAAKSVGVVTCVASGRR